MPQIVYNRDAIYGVPGQPFSSAFTDVIESRPALSAIPFGSLVELVVSGGIEYVQLAQDTHGNWATALLLGSRCFPTPACEHWRSPRSPVHGHIRKRAVRRERDGACRGRGLVWVLTDGSAAWGGNTWPSLGAVNVWHSSDGTHNQGVAHHCANTQTTSGQEIDAALLDHHRSLFGPRADLHQRVERGGFRRHRGTQRTGVDLRHENASSPAVRAVPPRHGGLEVDAYARQLLAFPEEEAVAVGSATYFAARRRARPEDPAGL